MSISSTHPREQSLNRQDSPLSTQPWPDEAATPLDAEASFPAEFEPAGPASSPGDSGRQASQVMSQGQRSLNGELHQNQMLNHLEAAADGQPGSPPEGSGSTVPPTRPSVSEDEIRELAYQIYLLSHGVEGHALDHWLEAERQLCRRHGEAPEMD